MYSVQAQVAKTSQISLTCLIKVFQYSLGAICCVLLVLIILVIVLLVSVFSSKKNAEVAVTVDSNGDSGVAVNVNLNFDEDKTESPLIHSDLTDAGAGAPTSGSAGPGQNRPWPPGNRKWNRNAPAASDTVFPVFPSYTVTVAPPKWSPINTGPGVGAGAAAAAGAGGAPSRRLQHPDSSEDQ